MVRAAGFYERYGAVRDVLQNHLSVMLALATGELKDDGSGGVDRTGLLRDVTPPQSAEFGQYEGYQEHVAADGVIDPAKGERAGAPTAPRLPSRARRRPLSATGTRCCAAP